MINSIVRSYEALIGCVSHDWFHSLSEQQLEEGVKQQDRDNIFRTYTMNNYDNHLMEIFLAVQNEYTDWEQVGVQTQNWAQKRFLFKRNHFSRVIPSEKSGLNLLRFFCLIF